MFGPVTGVEPSVRMREAAQTQFLQLARVLKPGRQLLLRANFSDHHPRPWWLEHFPRGFEVDASLFQPLHEVIAMFTSAGWRVARFGTITEPSSGTRGDMLERLRLRTGSFFAQISPDEQAAGFAAWSRLLPQIPVHRRPCPLSRSSRSNRLGRVSK